MTYIRRVKTKSGAVAIQVVRKQQGKIVQLEHVGSAHNQQEEKQLVELARDRLHPGQLGLLPNYQPAVKVALKASFSVLLYDVLWEGYRRLGLDQLADEVFAQLCIARMVEPTSKLDSLRVLADLGITRLDRNQLFRCLSQVISQDYRKTISQICFARAGQQSLSLVLYDVTSLYFEVQKEDEFRKPGLSKERRLEPQIIIGLLVNQNGFPLGLHSFEGNTAETKTILPVIQAFCQEHQVSRLTVVADAGMLSQGNLAALSAAGHKFIVGSRLHKIPYGLAEYQKANNLADSQILESNILPYRIIYQYKAKRAELDLKNIRDQIAKAQRVVDGKITVSRAKFLLVKAQTKQLNQKLITKAYALAGIKGYVTNLEIPGQPVIDYHHQLFRVEASFRMAKSDLKARPIFHRRREAIEAHLTLVLAALAVGKCLEEKAQMSLKQLVKLLRPIRSGVVTVNGQEYPAEADVSPVIHTLLRKLNSGH